MTFEEIRAWECNPSNAFLTTTMLQTGRVLTLAVSGIVGCLSTAVRTNKSHPAEASRQG